MSFKIKKINHILFLFLFFSLFYIAWPIIIKAATSPDAIAVRIVDNPSHYSSLNWYQSQKFVGSPQIMQIDGYEAVRNGRTVYINVANITDKNNDGVLDSFDNSIFIISYNQDAQGVTSDIFGQQQIFISGNFSSQMISETHLCQRNCNSTILQRFH